MTESLSTNMDNSELDTYSGIQGGTMKEIDGLIALGAPDWRLVKLPNLLPRLTQQKNAIRRG